MRQSFVFGFSMLFGAALVAALADENTLLALTMGGILGAAVAVMIVAFPLDLSYREPQRGKREVHVVMVPHDRARR